MAHQRNLGELPVMHNQPACIHLRSKAMYVTGELETSHVDEVDSHNQNCWCNKTQHTTGPNNELVSRILCVEGRECYVAR
jgi:hypothetical protein